MSCLCVSVFFRFLVKYFQLCIVTSLLPSVVNKAYHYPKRRLKNANRDAD